MAEGTKRAGSRLLDLRFVIAVLFLIFGVLVTGAGLMADDAEIAQAGGININLWTGLSMLVLSGVFFIWLTRAPVEVAHSREEVEDEQLDREWGEQDVPPATGR